MKQSVAFAFVGLLLSTPLLAQVDSQPPQQSTGVQLLDDIRHEQSAFERFRREHLPPFNGRGKGHAKDQDTIGRFNYWYDSTEPPPPPEPPAIKAQRAQLLHLLDSAATKYPEDDWTMGQFIRYLDEDEQFDREVAAALSCKASDWWCGALLGFAYHESRQYVKSDSAYARALRLMPQRLRCDWTDLSVLLDEYSIQTYHRYSCGTAERTAFEARMWWLAKPLYAQAGLDTKTEYLARMTMTRMLEDAPSAHQFGFDIDERELTLRYGWPRAWSEMRVGRPMGPLIGGGGMGMNRGGMGAPMPPEPQTSVVGHEPAPSIQFLMPATKSNSPAMSDSVDWETGAPPVHARYAPAYARKLAGLQHQSAMFRRGDSSLIVVAWDATNSPMPKGKDYQMALVLARADSLKPVITTKQHAPLSGYMIGEGPWSQLLMSLELTAKGVDTAVRARYGLRPPYALGARVTLSEMLFFSEYDGLPQTPEEAAPHALTSIKLRTDQKLGVYFESYGTNPNGEKLKVTFTVARVEDEPGYVQRRLSALRLSSASKPTRLTIEDQSRLGQRMTPRSAYVDVHTLKKGTYIVQLEVEVAGQYVVTTERQLEITN